MTHIQILDDEVEGILGDDFYAGRTTITEADVKPYLRPSGINIDLAPLQEAIKTEVLESGAYETSRSEIDQAIAPTVHQTIELTRREAAIDGLWNYLNVVHFTDYCRYRWQNSIKGKLLRSGNNIYRKPLHRLWWIAEITRDGDDYTRTRKIFDMQELADDVSERWFSRYQPLTNACVDELHPDDLEEYDVASSKIVSKTTTRLRGELTTVVAEALDYDEAVDLVIELRTDVIDEFS